MTKKKNIFVASLFALAIGSAFTGKITTTKLFATWQRTPTGCPPVTSICDQLSGNPCFNIFLDDNCSVQAYRKL